jgi:antitoxin MazE
MNVTVRKWGNSAAIRIPASIMEDLHLSLDEVLEVRAEEGRIIIEPMKHKAYDLNQLLEGITKKNLHKSQETGFEVGNEVW